LKRYREYLGLQPRLQDWEAVNAIVRSLEPPVAVPARPVVTAPVVTAPRSNSVTRPAPVAVTAPRSNPPVVAKLVPPVVVSKPVPSAAPTIGATPPPSTVSAVKSFTEHVVQPVVDDTRMVVGRSENPAPAPSNATEAKGLLSKLNPFKRDSKASGAESKPAATVAATTAARPAAGNNSEPEVTLTASKGRSGDRKAAEFELARGQQEQRAKRLAEALQFYRHAVSLDESYFEAHYCLGLAAFEIRNFKLAITAWQNAIALRSDSGDARYNYARALQADGRFSEAADELEKLLALHPDEARGHLTLGILYADKVRDVSRARLHYQRVLQLDPRNPQADAIRYWLVANPR
jgi:Flp pilus assembly protein TadD